MNASEEKIPLTEWIHLAMDAMEVAVTIIDKASLP